MGLIIQFLILAVLLLVLIALFVDEKRLKLVTAQGGKLTEYWDGTERRRAIRIKTILHTRYSIDKKPEQKRSLSKNISSGGIQMQLNEKLSASTPLALNILLPNSNKPVSLKGKVVWVSEINQQDESGRRVFNTGIEFVMLNPKDRERPDKHIKGLI